MSIVIQFLPRILITAFRIVNKAQQVKGTKRYCRILIDRIQILITFLQKPELLREVQANDGSLNRILTNLQAFLERCYDFISSFLNYSRIRRYLFHSSYNQKFHRIDLQLQTHYSELIFAVNINNLVHRQSNEHQLRTVIIIGWLPTQHNPQPTLNYAPKEPSKPFTDIFKNGIWCNRCFEYGKWYGPFQHHITFNFNDNTCDGYGEDHMLPFILTGSFSRETKEINLVMSYVLHSSEVEVDNHYRFRLTWNEQLCLFHGLKYEPVEYAVGLFEMSFVRTF